MCVVRPGRVVRVCIGDTARESGLCVWYGPGEWCVFVLVIRPGRAACVWYGPGEEHVLVCCTARESIP